MHKTWVFVLCLYFLTLQTMSYAWAETGNTSIQAEQLPQSTKTLAPSQAIAGERPLDTVYLPTFAKPEASSTSAEEAALVRLDEFPASGQTKRILQHIEDPLPKLLQLFITKNFPYKTVNLKDVLDLAEVRNLTTELARQRVKIERTRFAQTAGNLLPNFVPYYDNARLNGAIQVFGSQIYNIDRKTVNPGYQFAWRLYPGGSQIWDILAAKKRLKAESLSQTEVSQQELAGAAKDYFNFLGTYIMRDANKLSRTEAEALVKLDNQLLAEGKISDLDLDQATVYYESASHELAIGSKVVANMQYLLNCLNLDTTVGLAPAFDDFRLWSVIPPNLSGDAILTLARANNIGLQQASTLINAQKWTTRSTLSQLIPYVELSYSQSWRGPAHNDLARFTSRGMTVSTYAFYTMGVSPLAYYLEQRRKIGELKLQRQIEVRLLEQIVFQQYMQVSSLGADYDFQQKRYQAAERAYGKAVAYLKNGEPAHREAIEALRDKQQARVGMAQDLIDYNNAQLDLLQLMGLATKENILNGFKPAPSSASHKMNASLMISGINNEPKIKEKN